MSISQWVSEVPLRIRSLRVTDRQHFLMINFRAGTKITGDGLKEEMHFQSKEFFVNTKI